MMKLFLFTLSITLFLVCSVSAAPSSASIQESLASAKFAEKANNLGQDFSCVACAIVVRMLDNGVKNEEKPIEKLLDELCTYFPAGDWRNICEDAVAVLGPVIIAEFLKGSSPDDICSKFVFCHSCRLEGSELKSQEESERDHFNAFMLSGLLMSKLKMPQTLFGNPKEEPDFDKDGFSATHDGIRTADWRGMDCDDNSKAIHPGIYDDPTGVVDNNCNGIVGKNGQGTPYESVFCNGTGARTTVMFGDSASSGFHIPPEWLQWKNMSDIARTLEDEFDHPQLAWSTGFEDSINGRSINLNMRKRNRCNHRDYQNVGHNGAAAKAMVGQVELLETDPTAKPVLIFVAYIGNDVCSDTLEGMTTVEEFTERMLAGLAALDKKVPKGSHYVAMGLVDGRILWDTMHNLMHPLGYLYKDVYQFLSCSGANPCKTWLTPDEATRNATSLRAQQLSEAYQGIVAKANYSNFDMTYLKFPLEEAIELVKKMGKPVSDLIEPMDGFHPSVALAHRLFSDVIWGHLVEDNPEWIGEVNPANTEVIKVFGDQGGF